jgi:hypothetical protein
MPKDPINAQVTKLAIQHIRIGQTLETLEITNLKKYAEEEGLNYAMLVRCRAMYKLAKEIKAVITDERFEGVPEEQDNVEDLYPHLR